MEGEDGEDVEEPYTVAVPITDIMTIYGNIESALGITISEEQKANADSVYNLVRYGVASGAEGWIEGAEVSFISADGFCSPIGANWESRVTSEFGNRIDSFTGKHKGHTGSTGRSTGPHLHFEVRVNGEWTNPRYYLSTS